MWRARAGERDQDVSMCTVSLGRGVWRAAMYSGRGDLGRDEQRHLNGGRGGGDKASEGEEEGGAEEEETEDDDEGEDEEGSEEEEEGGKEESEERGIETPTLAPLRPSREEMMTSISERSLSS